MKLISLLLLLTGVLVPAILTNATAIIDPTTSTPPFVTETENTMAMANMHSIVGGEYQPVRKDKVSGKLAHIATRLRKREMGTPTIIAIVIVCCAAVSLIVACVWL